MSENKEYSFYIEDNVDPKLYKDCEIAIKRITNNPNDPFMVLQAYNSTRKKKDKVPLPITIIKKTVKKQSVLSILDEPVSIMYAENLDGENPFYTGRKDRARDLPLPMKKIINLRHENKLEKKSKGDKKREANRRKAQMSSRYEDNHVENFFETGSLEQLEHYAKAQRNKEARLAKSSKSEKKGKLIESNIALSPKDDPEEEKKELSENVSLEHISPSFSKSELKLLKEAVVIGTKQRKAIQLAKREVSKVALVESVNSELKEVSETPANKTKVNKLGFSKEEVSKFSADMLMKKQDKRIRKYLARKHVEYNEEEIAKAIIELNIKRPVGLKTESGSLCPIGELCDVLGWNTRSVIFFLYQCYKSTSFMDYFAACHQLVAAIGLTSDSTIRSLIDHFVQSCGDSLARWCSGKNNVLEEKLDIDPNMNHDIPDEYLSTEVGSIDELSSMFRSFIDGDLSKGLSGFLLSLASLKLLGSKLSSNVFSVFGYRPKMSILEFLESMMEALKLLLRFGKSIWNGIPLTDALMSKDPIGAACEKIEYLIKMKDFTYTGLPTEGYIDLKDFVSELESHVKILEFSQEGLSPLSPLKKKVKNMIVDAKVVLSLKKNEFEGATRLAPFGIVLTGSSGIGKGFLLRYIARLWSYVKKREFKDSHIFPRSATSQYWEGYMPYSHPIIHYSEVARFSKNHTASHGDSQIDELVSLIDSLTFRPDMAFGEKGKICALPELVLLDTNNKSLNADILYACPVAFRRRFVFVVPKVKDEFKQDNSTSIDPEKSMAAGGHMLDRYTFDVYVVRPDVNDKSQVKYILRSASLNDLSATLINMFSKHLEIGTRTKEAMDACDLMLPEEDKSDISDEDYSSGDENQWSEHSSDTEWNSQAAYLDDVDITHFSTSNVSQFKRVARESMSDDDKDISMLSSTQSGLTTEIGCDDVLYTFNNYCQFLKQSVLSLMWFIICWTGSQICIEGDTYYTVNIARIFIWMWLFHLRILGLLSLPFVFLSYSHIFSSAVNVGAERAIYIIESKADEARASLEHLFLGRVYNPFRQRIARYEYLTKYAKAVALALSCLVGYKIGKGLHGLFKRYKYPRKTETQSDEDMLSQFGIKDSPVTTSKINAKIWNTTSDLHDRIKNKPKHSGGLLSLYDRASKNTRKCVIDYLDSSPRGTTFVIGITGNYAIMNAHAFRGKDNIKISFETSSCHYNDEGYRTQLLDKKDCVRVTDDVILFSVMGERFFDIAKHFCLSTPDATSGVVLETVVRLLFPSEVISADDKYVGKVVVRNSISYQSSHFAGMCGQPIVGNYGSGQVIYGIHFSGAENSHQCYGIVVTQDSILKAISEVKSRGLSLFPINSQSGETSEVGLRSISHLLEPGFKSMVRYEYFPEAQYLGKLDMNIMIPKRSKLRRTEMATEVEEFFEETLDLGYIPKMYKPMMKSEMRDGEYINPHNVALRKLSKNKKVLKNSILCNIRDILVNKITKGLREQGITELTPLSISDAINGVVDDPYVRGINASTSGGFGFPGGKFSHLPRISEAELLRAPTPELREKINRIIELYLAGHSVHPIYSGKLKDEPRPIEKVRVGKTRMFYMQPLDHLIVSRMFLAPFYTLMVKYGELFCTAVGINMFTDSCTVYERMKSFSEHLIEGDYGGYDLMMPHGVGDAASAVVYGVLKNLGYNEDSLRVVQGLLTDNLFPYIEVLTDIFCVPGLQPSGKYATAEDNSLRGLILLMYAWDQMGFDIDKFFDQVLPLTYGDDVIAACKELKFNNVSYANFVLSYYGMDFTNPEKGQSLVEFVTVDTMSFLKRKFKYDERLGTIVGYLPPETFIKALTWSMPSSYTSHDEQIESTCRSMCLEFGLYCSSRYEEFRSFLGEMLIKYHHFSRDQVEKFLPTFEKVDDVVHGRDGECRPLPDDDSILDTDICTEAYSGLATQSGEVTELTCYRSIQREFEIIRPAENKELIDLYDDISSHPRFSEVFNAPEPLYRVIRQSTRNLPDDFVRKIQKYCDLKADEKARRTDNVLRTESGEQSSGQVLTDVRVNENVEDVVGEDEEKIVVGNSFYPEIGQSGLLGLSNFLSRPIEIANVSWEIGGPFMEVFPIWDLFSIQPSVRAKLRNFAYFSGDLNVRIEVSATPFHYGRLLASYQPYPLNNPTLVHYQNSLISFSDMKPLFCNFLSQAPGAVTIDPKSNKPVEMKIPFISTKPMFRLFNESGNILSAVTSYTDFERAGSLILTDLNALSATTDTATNAQVRVFVWATNVKLGPPTGTRIVVNTESGTYDERERGPVERFSSSAVEVSRALSSIPWISPFAKASSYIFNGVKTLSSIFGWSKPVVSGDPSLVKNEPFQNGSVTIGQDTAKRIVFDPKQEILIDPRCTATETDDLVIAELARKSSYLTTFVWNHWRAPMEPMWRIKSEPMLHTYTEGATHKFFQPSACAFAAYPFNFWNGKMRFRFEIVCSSFHRGKLLIMFEPNISQQGWIEDIVTLNKQFLIIVDIQETQDFDICVDWASPWYWQETSPVFDESFGSDFTISRPRCTNGYLIVMPFTSLQSQNASDVDINVYVSCDDLRVNHMAGKSEISQRVLRTESGIYSPEPRTCFTINQSSANMDWCSEYHFGEEPRSFRSALKRYVDSHVFEVPAETIPVGRVRLLDRNYPENLLPYGASSISSPGRMNLFSYLRYAYLGVRGGVRKRVHIVGDLCSHYGDQVKITNGPYSSTNTPSVSHTSSLGVSSLDGTVTFIPSTNMGVEYEVPLYTDNMFIFSAPDDNVGQSLNDTYNHSWNKMAIIDIDVSGNNPESRVIIETATGEDFTFMRYQGAPYFTTTLS